MLRTTTASARNSNAFISDGDSSPARCECGRNFDGRQREPERGAVPEHAVDANTSVLPLDEAQDDAQPQSEPTSTRSLATHPCAENALLVFGRNTRAVVGD